MALDDQTVGAPAERHRRGVVARNPGDDLLGSGDIRDDLFDGAPAPCEPRERQRGAQELHHVAPGDPFGKLRGALRELALESGAVFGAILDLRETSPVRSAHRWHPEQSVGGLTGRSPSCAASSLNVPRRRPLHVGDLRDGASVGTGVAVAVEAPAHTERRHLRDRFHLVDAAVAGDTADSCRHVRAVREIRVVGQLVDANPAHRPAALGAVPNRCEQLAVPLHGLMAVHARLRGRNVGDVRNLDRGVTVSAIETKLADVELVAVRDGLNGTVAHVCVPRGKVVPDARDREQSDRGCPRWRRRSGACSTTEGKSGPMARTPGRWRTRCRRPRVRDGTVMAHRRAPKRICRRG